MKRPDSIAAVFAGSAVVLSSLTAGAQEAPVAAAPVAESESAAAPASPPAEVAATPRVAVRDEGFYLRMTAGPGYAWASAPETAQLENVSVGAWTGNVSVHPGYMLSPGFAIHGDIFISGTIDYRVTSESNAPEYESVTRAITSQTFGAGLTYHSMPVDIYLSAGAGVSVAQAVQWHYSETTGNEGTISSRAASTEPGFGAHGSLGKFWALSKAWAIGGSVNYNFQSFGRKNEAVLSLQEAHTLWLGFSGSFQPQ